MTLILMLAALVCPADVHWRAAFTAPAETGGVSRVVLDDRRVEPSVAETPTGNAYVWRGLSLGAETNAVDVTVTVDRGEGAKLEWRFRADCRSKRWALEKTEFPVLKNLGQPGACDALIPTMNLGAKVVKNYDAERQVRQKWFAPSWFPMITAFMRDGKGTYIAAEDPDQRLKTLVHGPGNEVWFETTVENAGVPGKAAKGPGYPVVTAAFAGDWWEVARLYRSWALRQKWTRKGPMITRGDYPKAMAEAAIWLRISGSSAAVRPLVGRIRETWPGLNLGWRWYNWNLEKFDTRYPVFTPTPGMKDALSVAARRGDLAMPYVNGRLWDTNDPTYVEGRRSALLKADGTPYVENYAADFAVMCPGAGGYRRKLIDLERQVVEELGAPAIYYDQISCSAGYPCYDPSHGHPLGGGAWWADGYRMALESIHANTSAKGVPVTSEGCAEAYLDLIDGCLNVGRGKEEGDVPFFPAVYSGYTVYFCIEQSLKDDLGAFFARQTESVLWGQPSGSWSSWEFFNRPGPKRTKADYADVIFAHGKLRTAAKEFLVYGFLEDQLRPTKPIARKTFLHWPTRKKGDPQPVAYDAILGSVWRTVDGTAKAVFAANVSDVDETVELELPEGMDASNTRLVPLGFYPPARLSVNRRVATMTLKPRSVAYLRADLKKPSETFSKAEFVTPESRFYPGFFWMFTGQLDQRRLNGELDDIRAHGCRTPCIHPMPHAFRPQALTKYDYMKPDYLTDEHLKVLERTIGAGAGRDMTFWLYDEGGWPSGGCCGQVMASDPKRFALTQLAPAADGEWKIHTVPQNPAGRAPVPNVLQVGTIERFIELTHERMKPALGKFFGGAVKYTFTDEPPTAWSLDQRFYPWCDDFADRFREHHGYDPTPYFAQLVSATNASEDVARVRMDYMDSVTRIFCERYNRPLLDWCHANGLETSGHFNQDGEPRVWRTSPNICTIMRGLDLPGVDVIWRQLWIEGEGKRPPFPKLASSWAHQNGKRHVLAEALAIYGDGMTPSERRWVLDYLLVRGVNVFVFSYYRGEAREGGMAGGGPHLGPFDPMWDHMTPFFEGLARTASLVSQGCPVAPTAVYFDQRSHWASAEEATTAYQAYYDVSEALLRQQSDFDFVDDDLIAGAKDRPDGTIEIGKMRYSCLVLPTWRRLRGDAARRVAELESRGFPVVRGNAVSQVPRVCRVSGEGAENIRVMKRQVGENALYFVVNESRRPCRVALSFDEKRTFLRADPSAGEFVSLPSSVPGEAVWDSAGLDETVFLSGAVADRQERVFVGPTRRLDSGWELAERERIVVGARELERHFVKGPLKFRPVSLGEWTSLLGDEFAGKAVYRTTFASASVREVELDLGKVVHSPRVWLNGVELKGRYLPPYRWNVSLAAGENVLEVEVANALSSANGAKHVRDRIYADFPPVSVYERRMVGFVDAGRGGGLHGPVVIRELER